MPAVGGQRGEPVGEVVGADPLTVIQPGREQPRPEQLLAGRPRLDDVQPEPGRALTEGEPAPATRLRRADLLGGNGPRDREHPGVDITELQRG
jgi:hypothetical protein